MFCLCRAVAENLDEYEVGKKLILITKNPALSEKDSQGECIQCKQRESSPPCPPKLFPSLSSLSYGRRFQDFFFSFGFASEIPVSWCIVRCLFSLLFRGAGKEKPVSVAPFLFLHIHSRLTNQRFYFPEASVVS